jgi:hypothetical protein
VEQICRPWSGRQMMAAYMVYDLRELRRDEEPLNKSPGLEGTALPLGFAHRALSLRTTTLSRLTQKRTNGKFRNSLQSGKVVPWTVFDNQAASERGSW